MFNKTVHLAKIPFVDRNIHMHTANSADKYTIISIQILHIPAFIYRLEHNDIIYVCTI